MRVIFLDFDGVLNSDPFRRAIYSGPTATVDGADLDPANVARVQRICDETGAVIVVSSAWRGFYPIERLRAMLAAKGLTAEVIDVTPSKSFGLRHEEVAEWLFWNQHLDVESYVVLDDNPWAFDPARFVRTSDATGITTADADRAIRILKGD